MHDLRQAIQGRRRGKTDRTQTEVADMTELLVIAGVAFLLWRIEKIKSDIRDDIAFIEFTRDLPDEAGEAIKSDSSTL